MNHRLNRTLATLGLAAVGACFATSANAGCFNDALARQAEMQKQSWIGDGHVRLMNVDWRHHDDDIVGFWNITVIGKGNGPASGFDGQIIDQGLQQYHDDGTEMLNSSNQNPATQNYCMGVWEQTGPYHYKLNHFAYLYSGGTPNKVSGLAHITQEVDLSHDGNEISGHETTELYTLDRNLFLTLKGVLTGHRVKVGTTPGQIQ